MLGRLGPDAPGVAFDRRRLQLPDRGILSRTNCPPVSASKPRRHGPTGSGANLGARYPHPAEVAGSITP